MATQNNHLITVTFAAKNYAEVKKAIEGIDGTIKKVSDSTKPAVSAMGDFEKALRRAAIVAPVWMALRTAMQAVFNLIQDQVKFLVEMETAMKRIEIVGKGSTEEYNNMKNALVALSFAYGKTATDALEAAKIFAQQGKDARETLILTQQAMLAAQVLGTDIKTVVNDLTAALNGFLIPMQKSVSVIDKWIAVEKEFAVTSQDLAEATKVTGATANQLGLTISEFLGDVTSVIEVTRKSGSEAARGLGFIYARLLTSGKPVIEQLTKIPFYLDKQGQSTNELTGNLRPATQILGELADKWASLTREEKLNIATALGSKRQMTVLNALMQNYARSLDARVIALTSAGQAERAFNIIQDSTAFKLEQTKSAWNNLTNALGDTGAFKTSLDIFNNIITAATMLANSEKGYAQLGAKTVVVETNKAEKLFTQAANLREIIKLRDELSRAPATDANVKRIETLNAAITEASKTRPELKLAVELENKDVINKIIDDMQREALKRVIEVRVQSQFLPKILAKEEEKAAIQPPSGFLGKFMGVPEKAKSLQKDITSLYSQQSDEIDKQYKLALADFELYKGKDDLINDEVENEKELTDAQIEQLNIERQLSNLGIIQSDNIEKRIQKEIELVKNSKFLYQDQAKLLKLEQLHNQLIDEKLKKRQKEMDSIKNLLFQYEQADLLDRGRIERQIELEAAPDREVISAFETNKFDRNLILETINSFSQGVQDAIAKIIAQERGFNQYQTVKPSITESQFRPSAQLEQKQPFTYTPVQIGSIPITVNVEALNKKLNPEDTAEDISKQVKESILSDERYINALRNKI